MPGIKIDVAENGLVAIERVKANRYDVILMDVQMPEMNGYDATKNIRLMPLPRNKVPIIAMTASAMKSEVDRCYAAGMDEYVSKPFDTKELVQKINKLVQKH
jgi:CheY-like chemotaxis protein